MTSTAVTRPLLPNIGALTEAKRRLFDAAISLFGARGFHAVSVRDLAGELGMAPGAIYAHVESKQDLLFQLVELGLVEHRSRFRAALLEAGADPADQIRSLTRAHVILHLEFPALARVINRELNALTEEQYAAALAVRSDAEQMFLEVVERGVRLGAFDVEQPILAMRAIAGLGILAANWWTPEDPHPVDTIADTYADFAIRLLGRS